MVKERKKARKKEIQDGNNEKKKWRISAKKSKDKTNKETNKDKKKEREKKKWSKK